MTKRKKDTIMVKLANVDEGDPRLDRVENILDGTEEQELREPPRKASLVDEREAQRQTTMSKSSLWRLRKYHGLKAYRVPGGRRILYDVAELMAFMRSGETSHE